MMRRARDDAHRASDIVSRIRSMAAGRAPCRARLSLQDVIEEALAFLEHEIKSNDVLVTLECEPSLPMVNADRVQLQQVLVNLTVNAVQAMAKPGWRREKRIIIRTGRPDLKSVRCSVEDSGPGIDVSCYPRLFRGAFTTKETGMGLGLPISRSIIEAHDGMIRADNGSSLGGARFAFTLPAAVSASPKTFSR